MYLKDIIRGTEGMYSAKYKENEMLPLWETVKINCHHKRSISKQLHDCWFVTSYAIFFFFFAIINPIIIITFKTNTTTLPSIL